MIQATPGGISWASPACWPPASTGLAAAGQRGRGCASWPRREGGKEGASGEAMGAPVIPKPGRRPTLQLGLCVCVTRPLSWDSSNSSARLLLCPSPT